MLFEIKSLAFSKSYLYMEKMWRKYMKIHWLKMIFCSSNIRNLIILDNYLFINNFIQVHIATDKRSCDISFVLCGKWTFVEWLGTHSTKQSFFNSRITIGNCWKRATPIALQLNSVTFFSIFRAIFSVVIIYKGLGRAA